MDNADDLMMASYEDQQSGTEPVDDFDGFPNYADDDNPWPTEDEIADYESRPPDEPLTDEERAIIAEEWDRWGDEMDLLL